jgi:hypothetical protein
MKSTTMRLAAALALVFAISAGAALAQDPGGKERPGGIDVGKMGGGMMGRGMMGMGGMGGMAGQGRMMGRGGMMEDGMMGFGGGEMMERLVIVSYLRNEEELGLSDEQVKKLEGRRTSYLKEAIGLHAKLQIGRIELKELLDQDSADMAAVEKKVRANQDVQCDLILAAIRANQDAKNILTPDQRKKAKALKHEFMGERMGARKAGFEGEKQAPRAPMERGRRMK